ncbi:MAG: TonB-dependent receptor domain-containing protein [Terriglobales bacterium]
MRCLSPRPLRCAAIAALGVGAFLAPKLRAQQVRSRETAIAASAPATAVVTVFDPSGAVVPRAQVQIGPAPKNGHAARLQTVISSGHGQARFGALAAGAAVLHVSAAGFEPVTALIHLLPGANPFQVHLRLAAVKQNVTARAPAATTATTAFSFVLTPQQIEQLPDDPDQFAAALQALAGPAAGPEGPTMVVDGFTGGQLPPKSQIQSIIIDLNPYSAANHTATGARIEIFTRPGVGAWHGQMSAAGRDTTFDSRNAFSPDETPEAYRRFGINLEGPLEANQSSVFLSLRAMPTYDSSTILATTPTGLVQSLAIQPAKEIFGRVQVNQALSKTLQLRVEYQRNYHGADEQGVGGLALPSRAYSSSSLENLVRLSLTGAIGAHAVNQMRFQANWQTAAGQSAINAPSLTVAGAFESGGAQTQTANQSSDWQLDDDFSYSLGSHVLHAGFRVNQGVYQLENASNALGSFTFASLADFVTGRPSLFTQRVGYPWIGFPFANWAGYVQDDWQVNPRLALSLGARYEGETDVPDDHAWAPRFMLTWAPWGGKTLLRLGGGLFNDFLDSGAYSDTLLDNGVQQYDVTILDPGYPDPTTSGTPQILPPSVITLSPGLLLPYREQGSAMLSRPFGGFRLMAGYFFQRGVHEFRSRNLNAPLPGAPPGDVPFPGQGNRDQIESDGNSLYQALRVGLSYFSARQFFAINYALAQSLNDNDGALSLPANNYDLAADWGPAGNDSTDQLFAIWSRSLTRSIRLFTMFHDQSALPYNITTSGISQNGQTNTRPPGVGRNSARGDAQWDVNTRLSWTYAWGPPPPGARPRRPQTRVMRGPGPGGPGGYRGHGGGGRGGGFFGGRGGAASDHRFSLEFYAQAFNLFNHVNFSSYDGVLGSPLFGQPLAAGPARRMEAGLWFRF